MSIKLKSILLLTCASLFISSVTFAHNLSDEEQYEYKHKLILIQGKYSSVMKGEPTPIYNFNKKKVLPYYLARGWTIQHVYFNERVVTDNIDAYVVIEKWIKTDKRFSRR